MPTIQRGREVVTLINVFTVEPAKQQELVDLLTAATQSTMKELPGFVSASIHKSLDGTHVVNYAQWRSRADFDAMLEHQRAAQHMKRASELAKAEPHLYEVASVHTA